MQIYRCVRNVALVGFDSRIWVSGDIYRPVYLTVILGFDEIDQLSKRKMNTCGSPTFSVISSSIS